MSRQPCASIRPNPSPSTAKVTCAGTTSCFSSSACLKGTRKLSGVSASGGTSDYRELRRVEAATHLHCGGALELGPAASAATQAAHAEGQKAVRLLNPSPALAQRGGESSSAG
ncbi:unnamed protein product [Closterium sp. Yama58-4]|nr:unnamed protein product [Closterium sp. Yama58-4]